MINGLLISICLFLVIITVVGVLLGALVLKWAIAMCNSYAGGADSPDPVLGPSFKKALGTVLVGILAGIILTCFLLPNSS